MIYKPLPAALSFLLAATLAASPLAFAQAPQQASPDTQPSASQPVPARTANPHRQALRMARELNLTPDQTTQIEPILANRDQKIAALRADGSLAPRVAKKQMQAIRQSTRSQLSSVLTPDQLNQLKSVQHAHAHPGQAQPAAAAPSA